MRNRMNSPQSTSSLLVDSPEIESGALELPSTTSKTGVPLLVVTRCLALVICVGAVISIATQYTWLPVRENDLYAWSPGAPSYRPFHGKAYFVLPGDYEVPRSGMLLDDNFPGMQVFRSNGESVSAFERRILSDAPEIVVKRLIDLEEDKLSWEWREFRRKLAGYSLQQNSNSTDSKRLVIHNVPLVVQCPNPSDDEDNWVTWSTKLNNPRLYVTLFSDRQALRARYAKKLKSRPYARAYTASPIYWLLTAVPIVLLLVNQATLKRFFGAKRSGRQALFENFPKSTLIFKRWVVDPLAIAICYLEADIDMKNVDLLSREVRKALPRMSVFVTVSAVALAALVAFLSANRHSNQNASYRFIRFDSTLFWNGVSLIMLILKALVLGLITCSSYMREMRDDIRLSSYSMQRVILAQLLMGGVFSEILWRLSPKRSVTVSKDRAGKPTSETAPPEETIVLSLAEIESGVTKFATSILFYTAGATKLGEAGGFGFINDSFLAELAVRGRYAMDDRPYPLEPLLLYVPRAFRAAGMAVILLMEVGAIFSWWNFFLHLAIWFIFMTGSSLSIGVPFRADLLFPMLGADRAKSFFNMMEVAMAVGVGVGVVVLLVVRVLRRRMAKAEKTEKTG